MGGGLHPALPWRWSVGSGTRLDEVKKAATTEDESKGPPVEVPPEHGLKRVLVGIFLLMLLGTL